MYTVWGKLMCIFILTTVQDKKNNTMIDYLMWRVVTGRHTFFFVGHTKFSPDWCFRLFKHLFKRTRVNCMTDIAEVVTSSAVYNVSHIVHTEDTEIVPTWDWPTFLLLTSGRSHTSRGVITSTSPRHLQGPCSSKSMLTHQRFHCQSSETLGNPLAMNYLLTFNLVDERKWYLYERIHPFCSEEHRDVVTPEPSTPNLKRRHTTCP